MLHCICGVREPPRKRLSQTSHAQSGHAQSNHAQTTHDKAYLRERYPRRAVDLPAYVRGAKGRYTLGEGKHGKVKAASRLHDGYEVAIKSQSKQQWLVAKGETELARRLQLDHVIRVLDWAEGPKKSYIVMEHGAPVHTDDATPASARAVIWDIIAGLREIHARDIYHRDIGVYAREKGATLKNIMVVKNTSDTGADHDVDAGATSGAGADVDADARVASGGDMEAGPDAGGVYKMTDIGKMACSPPAALRAVYARADARGLCRVMHAFLKVCDPAEAAPFHRWYTGKRHLRVEDVAAHPWLRGDKGASHGSRVAALAYPLHVFTEWATSPAPLLTGRGQPGLDPSCAPSSRA